jgi:hypothetical protein
LEVSIVWLMMMGLMLGAVGILVFISRGWHGAGYSDLGWMSQQWLAEYRAGGG